MNTSKTWLKKAIVFLVVAAMAITLFPFTGLKTVTKAKEGPNSLFAETEKYQATVSFGDDAGIPAGAYLVLTEFEEGSSEYAEAKDTLIQEDNGLDEGNFGMAAFDLTIYDAEGVPFEPSAPVQVNIQMKELPEDVDAASVAIQHLDESTGDTVVETVATTVPDEAGMVEVIDDTAEAEFTVESFSTFALTWKVGETEYSATIHWGYIGDGASSTASGEFHEFDASDLDTAVGSVNLRASYSGYEYVDAVYYTSIPDTVSIDASTSVEGRTFINDVITKEVATGSSSDYHWMAEDAQNAATPFTVANGSHIYVAYREPDPGHVPDPTPTEHDDIPTPVTNKKVVTNKNTDGSPDGTYTIELDITGKQIAETHKTGANVIIIYDISQSMSQSVGNITRLEASRRATHTLIETLNPGTNDIDLALITFAQDSQVRQFNGSNWTKNGSNITNVIDGITNVSSNLGTSWHEALEDANGLVPPDDDPTYVIFITDGCPSVNGLASSGHSHGAAGTSNTTDLCYTSAVAYAQILAGTKGQSYSSRVSSGNQSWTISGTGKGEHLYGIYTGTDTNNMLGQLITAAEGTGVITATSEDAIKTAFQNIAQTIVNNLGASGVTTTDGVTELSSLSADVHGAAGAFEYYRRGGKVKDLDGTEHEKYSSSANGGLGVTWADAPGAIYNDDGSVTWDLSSVGVAEADVTYVLRFTVWPSQEAYDLIANLNNGAVDYEDLDSDIQNQVYESGGKYYLKTNTTLNTSYTYKGKTYTDPVSFEQGQMILNETLMNVRKAFADTINSEDPFTSIIFYLKMTNPKDKGTEKEGTLYYYQTDGSLNEELVTEGTVKVKELPVNTGNGWKNSIYIAPGLMEGTEVLEEGHKYTLEEKIVQGSEYEYEFTPQTVRPMIIDGTLTYLVLVDEYNAPGKNGVPADAKTYTIEGETYYVASTNNGELVGTNRKTAELDITKIVDTNEILTKDEEEEESFTYRVTLQIPHDNRIDPAGIMGYEYVNRPTQDNAFYAYGYHQYTKEEWEALGNEGDPPAATAYSEDKDRLGGNKYRRYNTHVYRDLLADGGWTTVGGKVKLVRDSDGNIQWKNDPVGGYHTVTYDMTLKQSELIRFTNLPSGTKYTIQEIYANKYVADNNGNSSGLAPISDASNIAEEGYAVTVKSTDGTVSKTAVDNDTVSGTISGLDTRYYNQFTNTMTKTVDVNLAGTKNLEGYEWSGESYHFTLETTGSNPMPAEATGKTEFDLTAASGNSDQTDTFGRIRFTAAGTYTYTVSETNAGTLQIVNGKAVQFGDAVTMTIVIQEDETTHDLSVKSVTGTGASWDADSKTATATITNTAPTVDIQATKEWLNEDGTKTPPSGAKATFTLYADGEKTDKSIVLDGTVDTNGETAEWVATFSGLQKYKVVEEKTTGEDGEEIITSKIVEIVYTVDETAVTPEGAYAKTNTDPVGNEGTIINEEQVTEVSGTKTWVDNNDQDGLRPDSITVTVIGRVGEGDEAETVSSTDHVVGLDENGKALEGTTVDADDENKWSFTFGNLPRFSDGKIISYSIVETDENVPSGYTRTADGNDITNTHTPATTDVTATKTWSDAGNQDGFRPASVVYALYKTPKGGTETAVLDDEGKAVTATLTGTGDEWTYTFEDLPAYESGKELTYTIKEMNGEAAVADGETLPGLEGAEYTAAYGKDGLTVTNSYTPATITINGTKTWDDEKYFDEEGNPVGDYERPEITINLSGTVEGAEEPVVTVTAT
ncbi:MAG: Cna B-type domain-containing protein, partial [Aeriscardovia sp.]|nr:Cna B-type domain-containing protein [Aeriscardovia sp.]MBR4668514.1 Cna B-type domain-containing protein [Butyrivibrio sp.]